MVRRPKVAIKIKPPTGEGFIPTRESREVTNLTEERIKSTLSQCPHLSFKESFCSPHFSPSLNLVYLWKEK